MRARLKAQETAEGWRVRLSADALFGDGDDTLADTAPALLADLAALIVADHAREIVVAGHTDGAGDDDDNRKLSERRADAVVAWLAAHAPHRRPLIRAQAFGRTRPIAPNRTPDGADNPDGRALNRRVEIFLRR